MSISRNPWIETYLTLLRKVSQGANGIPLSLPSVTGPIRLLATLFKKETLKGLLTTNLGILENAIEQITFVYTAFYQRILDRIKPTPQGYIAGGCFLPSSLPLIVLKDPFWLEFQHFFPIARIFCEPLQKKLSSALFLATPAHALRWFDPCEDCISGIEGIIAERNEATFPWEDLVPLFRMIQASGKTLIMAGPPEMEDWEFAQRDLDPKNLMVLFYITSFSELRFWSEYLY